jgi:hypothetical protein
VVDGKPQVDRSALCVFVSKQVAQHFERDTFAEEMQSI